jgi:hypothetical protein
MDHFDIVLFAHGMSCHEHHDTVDEPYRLQLLFAVFDTIELYESIGCRIC